MPILTVIIVTYNQVKTISKTIESVLSQTTYYPFIIHICDDCSTDGTAEICQKFSDEYPDKISFFPQDKNTFYGPIEENHIVKLYERIKTKYFCIIEGDDYYCNNNFLQIGITTLNNNEKHFIFGADTLVVDTIERKEYRHINNNNLKEYHFEELKAGNFKFILSQSRIYRNTFTSHPQGDMLVYLYHLKFGPIIYHNEVVAVYNFNGAGVSSSLPQSVLHKTQGIVSYRICQMFGFEKDYGAMFFLNNQSANLIKKISRFIGLKRAWNLWFFFTFVPSLGIEIFNINYGCIRKKSKQKYSNIVKKLVKILLEK